MTRVVSTCGLLLSAGILWGAWCCGSIVFAGEMRVDQWRSNQTGGPQFVAIMGEVGRPGVFELSNPLPELADLVRLAGGKSASASGSVRIMRGGRMTQLFLSPKLHYALLPNDMVVVESKQFSTARNFADSGPTAGQQRNPDGVSRASEPTIIQLGLVNLINRPVILDVAPGQAQLNQLLSMLRQASSGSGSIMLYKPGAGMQEVSLDEASQTPLSSGTVLIFNPSTVNVGLLPRLPNTVKPNSNDADAAPAAIESATQKVTAAEAVLRVPSDSAGDRPLLLPQTESSTRTVPISSPADSVQNAIVGASSQVDDVSAANDNEISDPASVAEESQPPESAEERQPAADQNGEQSPRTISGTAWAILAAMLACCLAPLLWSRRKASVRPPVAAPAPIAAATIPESSLKTLVSGSMKIQEEPLELPFESKIFGQPRKRSGLVFDRAHELGGPHYQKSSVRMDHDRRETAYQNTVFGSVSSADSENQEYEIAGARHEESEPIEIVAPTAMPDETADLPHDRKVRLDKAHPRSNKGVLDRVLATFEGEYS